LIVDSKIFSGVRNFLGSKSAFIGEMINCAQCCGFWVGVSLSLLINGFYPMLVSESEGFLASAFNWVFAWPVSIFLGGVLGSGSASVISSILYLINTKISLLDLDIEKKETEFIEANRQLEEHKGEQ